MFETKYYNRWAAYSVAGFGLSGVLATAVLLDSVRQIILGSPGTVDFQLFSTYGALFSFLVSTELIVFVTFMKFWAKGKVERR